MDHRKTMTISLPAVFVKAFLEALYLGYTRNQGRTEVFAVGKTRASCSLASVPALIQLDGS